MKKIMRKILLILLMLYDIIFLVVYKWVEFITCVSYKNCGFYSLKNGIMKITFMKSNYNEVFFCMLIKICERLNCNIVKQVLIHKSLCCFMYSKYVIIEMQRCKHGDN